MINYSAEIKTRGSTAKRNDGLLFVFWLRAFRVIAVFFVVVRILMYIHKKVAPQTYMAVVHSKHCLVL